MNEEKRYYKALSGEGIVEFPAQDVHRAEHCDKTVRKEPGYFGRDIPAWLAEAAIAHWKLLREHPDAERILRAWKALEKNKWRVFWWPFTKQWAISDYDGAAVDTTVDGMPHSYDSPHAAVEAALAATEKVEPTKTEPADEWPKWYEWSNSTSTGAKYIRFDRSVGAGVTFYADGRPGGDEDYHRTTSDFPAQSIESCSAWHRIPGEPEVVRQWRERYANPEPCECWQAEPCEVSITISGTPEPDTGYEVAAEWKKKHDQILAERDANYVHMDIVKPLLDTMKLAVQTFGENLAGGEKP